MHTWKFLSTLSLRRATDITDTVEKMIGKFLSTLSLRRATPRRSGQASASANFYPRSPCGERHDSYVVMEATKVISIHALLAESDRSNSTKLPSGGISIHALLAESDGGKIHDPRQILISIHALLAESDKSPANSGPCIRYFYPRSPCGERPQHESADDMYQYISIHALLAESDVPQYQILDEISISIHALLAESDPDTTPWAC